MKLKKKHFKRLQEIAKETNENRVFGMTGIRLNRLIADIELVQKPKEEFAFTDIDQLREEFGNIKTVQEKPLSATGFVGNVEFTGNIFNDSIKQEFAKSYMRQGKAMVAASTDDSTEFKGGLREAVEVTHDQKPLIVEIEKDQLVELYDFAFEQAKITGSIEQLHDIDRRFYPHAEPKPTPSDISDFLDEALVLSNTDPKIGDVGYFWSETSEGYIQYGVLKEILNDGYKSKLDLCYDYFSKTPPELK